MSIELENSSFAERAEGGTNGFCESLRNHSFCLLPLTDEESTLISNLLSSGQFLFVDEENEAWPTRKGLIDSCLIHHFSCGTRDAWFTGFKALKQRQVHRVRETF